MIGIDNQAKMCHIDGCTNTFSLGPCRFPTSPIPLPARATFFKGSNKMDETTRVYLNRNHCEDLLRAYQIPYMFMLADAKKEKRIAECNPSAYKIYLEWVKYKDEYDRMEREDNERKKGKAK